MGDAPFQQITDSELVELIERRSPHHKRCISRGELRAFMDGLLVPRDAAAAAAGEGRVMDISGLVEALIQHGVHKVTDSGKGDGSRGMGAAQYRRLWPKTVTQPPAYTGRFDRVLLVDKTVELATLVKCGNTVVYTDPASCKDVVSCPTKEDGTPLTRYAIFFQDGVRNNGRSVEDCRDTFTPDEVGLVTVEGLHLPIQYESVLRDHGVDLPGSRSEDWSAPCVVWFGSGRPRFGTDGVRYGDSGSGSASRGSVVIPVT